MTSPLGDLADRYYHCLSAYLNSMSETELAKGYQWSRSAIAHGIGLLEVTSIHHQACKKLLQNNTQRDVGVVLESAEAFFLSASPPSK